MQPSIRYTFALAPLTGWEVGRLMVILDKAAIAMHCNLRPPDVTPIILRFIYDVKTKFEVGQPIRLCSYFALHSEFDLWPWPWTFSVYIDCTKFVYQILAKSTNSWPSCSDFNSPIWVPSDVSWIWSEVYFCIFTASEDSHCTSLSNFNTICQWTGTLLMISQIFPVWF